MKAELKSQPTRNSNKNPTWKPKHKDGKGGKDVWKGHGTRSSSIGGASSTWNHFIRFPAIGYELHAMSLDCNLLVACYCMWSVCAGSIATWHATSTLAPCAVLCLLFLSIVWWGSKLVDCWVFTMLTYQSNPPGSWAYAECSSNIVAPKPQAY